MGCLVIPKEMQLNIKTKEGGWGQSAGKSSGRETVSNRSACFILSASYCHLVAKLKMEIETVRKGTRKRFSALGASYKVWVWLFQPVQLASALHLSWIAMTGPITNVKFLKHLAISLTKSTALIYFNGHKRHSKLGSLWEVIQINVRNTLKMPWKNLQTVIAVCIYWNTEVP